jgi:serine acetyltransferase
MRERIILGTKNRLLQVLAQFVPGATTWRVWLHRWRGVHIGTRVWIGYNAVIETSSPELVTLKDGASVGIGCIIIGHMRERHGVVIEEDVDIGPGSIILPGVTIGRGSAVLAGSVVTHSVPSMTVVQGNPARPIATTGIPFRRDVSTREWMRELKPIRS